MARSAPERPGRQRRARSAAVAAGLDLTKSRTCDSQVVTIRCDVSRLCNCARSDGDLTDFMTDQFPWRLALSERDRNECAREVLDAARASLSVGQSHLAVSALTFWRETAETLAAGLGPDEVDCLDDSEPVTRPRHEMAKDFKVDRPAEKSEYGLRFATRQTSRARPDLCVTIRGLMTDAWDLLTRTPLEITPTN